MSAFELRAHEQPDIRDVARLLMRPAINRQTMMFRPYTSESDAQEVLRGAKDCCRIVATEKQTAAIVGVAMLFRNDSIRSHSASLSLAVHDHFHRRGIGSALLGALIESAEGGLGIHRLTLKVYADNLAAIKLYERFGFEREGTLRREVYRERRYDDAHLMARLSGHLR